MTTKDSGRLNTDTKIIYIRENTDELLTKRELCEKILHCDFKTAEKHFINKEKFPYYQQGNLKKFPRKAVEKWIHDNTHYN